MGMRCPRPYQGREGTTVLLPATSANPPMGLPDGVVPVPLSPDQVGTPVRVCILYCRKPVPPQETPLVVIREEMDGAAYLGCLTDAQANLLDWLEIRVQKPDCLLRQWAAADSALTNRDMDARWLGAVRFARDHDRGLLVTTGWEETPPPPLFIGLPEAVPWQPRDPASGTDWVLCRDDSLLQDAGLPAYGASAARYLYLPGRTQGKRFVPVTPGAPANDATAAPEEVFGDAGQHVPVNPWAGFIQVRRFIPTTLREYADVLAGRPWDEVARHPDILPGRLPGNVLMDAASRSPDRGRLFVAHHSASARWLEAFYLRLLVFQSVLCEIRDVTEALGRPLLNLTDESFRIVFGADSAEGPFLWNARAVLSDTGTAVAIEIQGGENAFASLSPSLAAPYAPLAARAPFTGYGSVRIRRVAVQADCVVLEGTLAVSGAAQEICPSDVIRMRLHAEGQVLDLCARGDQQAALAENECRFASYPIPSAGKAGRNLERLEGVRFPRVPFEVIPCLSTPCDLYSAGVLACRLLLQSPKARLAEVLDEVLGLSHQLGLTESDEPLGARVRHVFERDARWLAVLGPQVLAAEGGSAERADEALPPQLWFDLLAAVTRLFPEMGSHSICKSFSDVQPGGLHRIFDTALADFRDLSARARSILLNDVSFSQEVRAVIGELLTAADLV